MKFFEGWRRGHKKPPINQKLTKNEQIFVCIANANYEGLRKFGFRDFDICRIKSIERVTKNQIDQSYLNHIREIAAFRKAAQKKMKGVIRAVKIGPVYDGILIYKDCDKWE